MRKLSILLFVLAMSIASFGQFGQSLALDSATVSVLRGGSSVSLSNYSLSSSAVIKSNQIEIHSGIKGAIVEVRYNGDLYILPSIVCDCDKCKRYDSLKFIYNIYTNKK